MGEVSRTGSHPPPPYYLHSMGSIKYEKDSMDFMSSEVEVVSGYAHLITSGD